MDKVKGIIDRIEGDFVVVEINGITKDYIRANFPAHAKPGDVVYIEKNKIIINKRETEILRKQIENLMDEVWDD